MFCLNNVITLYFSLYNIKRNWGKEDRKNFIKCKTFVWMNLMFMLWTWSSWKWNTKLLGTLSLVYRRKRKIYLIKMHNFFLEFLSIHRNIYFQKKYEFIYFKTSLCLCVCVCVFILDGLSFSVSENFNIYCSSPLFVADPSFGMTLKMR